MSFAGSLLDLGVVDVLEFLSISQRSGVVRFVNPMRGEVNLILSGGKFLSGTSSRGNLSLGSMLRKSHGVGEEAIEKAINRQREGENLPLGSLLIEQGDCTPQAIEAAMASLIEALVQELVSWGDGTFTFDPGEVEKVDQVAHYPGFLREGAEVDVRNVLMEAVRLFDETERSRTDDLSQPHVAIEPAEAATAADSDEALFGQAFHETHTPGAHLRTRAVIIISDDMALRATISRQCAVCGWDTLSVALVQEARAVLTRLMAADAEVVIVGDTGITTFGNFGKLGGMPGARRLREEYPQAPLIVVGDEIDDEWRLMAVRLGAQGVLDKPRRSDSPREYPSKLEAFGERLLASIEGAFTAANQAFIATRTLNDELRSLRDCVADLRSRSARSTVSLALLQHVAQNLDRAVLFLCRKGELMGIGAFGQGQKGESISELVVGSRINLETVPAIARSIEQDKPYKGNLSHERGFAQLYERIGAPLTGEGLILPVKALDRVAAVVYADNGINRRPLITTYGLEVLASQAGLMLENVLLRRSIEGLAQP